MKALAEGQYVKHFQYGCGVITEWERLRSVRAPSAARRQSPPPHPRKPGPQLKPPGASNWGIGISRGTVICLLLLIREERGRDLSQSEHGSPPPASHPPLD